MPKSLTFAPLATGHGSLPLLLTNEAFRVFSSGVSVMAEEDLGEVVVAAVEEPDEDLPEEPLEAAFFRSALARAISAWTARWMAASISLRCCCFFFRSVCSFCVSFFNFSAFCVFFRRSLSKFLISFSLEESVVSLSFFSSTICSFFLASSSVVFWICSDCWRTLREKMA